MIDLTRTFTVTKPVDVVREYLKDFSNAEEWDPGTKSCIQETTGPVEVGTTWHNVSVIKGKETELTYRLHTVEPTKIVLIGENKTATSTDTMTFEPAGNSTTITYHAEIVFHGLAKLATPFLQSEFDELGDKTQEQLTRVINSL